MMVLAFVVRQESLVDRSGGYCCDIIASIDDDHWKEVRDGARIGRQRRLERRCRPPNEGLTDGQTEGWTLFSDLS